MFVSPRFSNLNGTNASLHLEASKAFFVVELWKKTMTFQVGLNLTTFSAFCFLNYWPGR